MSKITSVKGKAMYLPGENIDTDRIIPARFLKCVTFNGIEAHLFEDERAKTREKGEVHPFDDPQNQGASILVVDTNFGCGSSREHAVQCIKLWGIEAIVSCAKSGSPGFADIFRGNAASNGIPCVELAPEDHEKLIGAMRHYLGAQFKVNLEQSWVGFGIEGTEIGQGTVPFAMREDHRQSLLAGTWDTISVLLEAGTKIEETAAQLPYLV